MRHWTPPRPEYQRIPARKPWEIAVDVLGALTIGAWVSWFSWVAIEPAIKALADMTP